MKKIRKLAIANRGEVAVRIIHACEELGIKTVLLHSEVDQKSLAYRLCDEPICIGPAPTAESYLNIQANIAGAKAAGADAIHPGFGFLSENVEFAKACSAAGIIFVGPPAAAIEKLGDKIQAKLLADKVGVPTIPGYKGEEQTVPRLIQECEKIGYPVIVKAAAGGGGRGMKVIRSSEEAQELIESAQREALAGFGSSVVFLEKYLDHAKHIEIQLFGSTTGKVFHLYERECSVQRRHQKIIEEAGSAKLPTKLRDEMAAVAVKLAEAAGYRSAGTAEFLVQDGQFYFLEINTRLQVEHPVSEMVTGLDLVKAQILQAQGADALWKQEDIRPRGHSIECRLYAEDPYNRGIPSTGKLKAVHFPQGPGRRFEYGFEAGDEITSYYDPMIAKVIVHDETRARAIQKMISVLNETVVFGVRTNIPYLKAILSHSAFMDGTMTTRFIDTYFSEGLEARAFSEREKAFIEFAQTARGATTGALADEQSEQPDPWFQPWKGGT